MPLPLNRNSAFLRRLLALCWALATLRYVLWRLTQGVPSSSCVALEVLGYTLLALECLQVFNQQPFFASPHSRSREAERQLDWHAERPPRIVVLIPTYGEAWEILERTLVGALGQSYSNYEVWVLDDGRREWLRQRVATWGIRYVTREDNRHYKAGNLNHALGLLRDSDNPPEYVAVLDADSIARPDFLRRTLALMRQANVAIVQTPQVFYNPDPFQRIFGIRNWPEEERWWFNVVWPAQDARNGAQCCGTGCLLRVRALQAIGGFPVASLTEDILCSMLLRRAGWQTVYLWEPLVLGLAAQNLAAWFSQRTRWIHGEVQNQRALQPRGVIQRLAFLRLPLQALEQLCWTAAYVSYWSFGYWVLPGSVGQAALYFLPLWLSSLSRAWLSNGCMNPLIVSCYDTLQRFLWIRVPLGAALFEKRAFVATEKPITRERFVVHWRLLRGHALTAFALLAGVVYNVCAASAPAHDHAWKWANVALTACLLLQLLVATAPTLEAPQRRRDDRYETAEDVVVSTHGGHRRLRCKNMSVGGLLLEPSDVPISQRVKLQVESVGWIEAELLRRSQRGAAFRFSSPELRPALIRKLYCTGRYVPLPSQWKARAAGLAVLRWLARPMSRVSRAAARSLGGSL